MIASKASERLWADHWIGKKGRRLPIASTQLAHHHLMIVAHQGSSGESRENKVLAAAITQSDLIVLIKGSPPGGKSRSGLKQDLCTDGLGTGTPVFNLVS